MANSVRIGHLRVLPCGTPDKDELRVRGKETRRGGRIGKYRFVVSD